MDGRAEVIAAGKWLVEERRKRGGDKRCPQGLVAALAKKRGDSLDERFKLAQQQISEIERAREDNDVGPKKGLPHWWRHVRWLVESGELDAALAAIDNAGPPKSADEGETYLIQAPNGEIVGRIIWTKQG